MKKKFFWVIFLMFLLLQTHLYSQVFTLFSDSLFSYYMNIVEVAVNCEKISLQQQSLNFMIMILL